MGVPGREAGLCHRPGSRVRNKAKTSVTQVLAVLSPSRVARTLFEDSFHFSPLVFNETPNDANEHIHKGPSKRNSQFI